MTDERLQEIEARIKAATKGWTEIPKSPAEDEEGGIIPGAYSYPGGVADSNGDAVCTFGWDGGSGWMFEHQPNADLIVNAPTDIADLIAEVRAGRDKINRMQTQVNDLMSESAGVAGLHLNGELADWDWLLESWLSEFDQSEAQND